ncbi:Holliday junction resolvase RuvX [Varunaivibrio sulfuroxidans]|uniref:Putative pre-16S rRNA nuclease n=1 Tax=Varunaivibrio sulfuroxidans TaxID=1773489 RepID=A0A4R3J9E9_9PROT|nr:Holliday junction resolvase RuvX [Varunaivibrio sulfuroxidans]TCS62498.1 putative Holliday junction resolvase [Varunaivibrio sulfuroxidans]WES30831.1 Holliday junction resolvase RuvX [Varunaivibrio sulfuroxidans]
MSIVDIAEIETGDAHGRRLMGLDLGSKTIGLALSDVRHAIASPLLTIQRAKFTQDALRLQALIEEHDVGALILGLPVSMDGGEGPRCQSTRQFAQNFLARHDIPLAYWDERLSTSAIERMLIDDVDMSRGRRADVIDKLAATYILQGALDAIAHLKRTPR